MKLVFFLLFMVVASFHAKGGAPINFVGFKNPSAPIFSKAGPTTINYQLYDEYTGIHKPGAGLTEEGLVSIVIRDSNNSLLYQYSVTPLPGAFGGDLNAGVPVRIATGSFQFSNPSNQNLIIEEQVWYNRPLEFLAGFPSQEWSSASGRSLVSGGDSPPVVTPPPATRSNIHAVIISERSDPTKVVTSPNVTLTGGVIALGKDPSPPAKPTAQWSSGLLIVPNEALLTGAKIPPLTPNIIDVRIVKHEVTGDLLTPAP